MKLKHLFVAFCAIALVTLGSCKKDEDEKEKTTIEKIRAKWGVENLLTHYDIEDVEESDNYTGVAGDYFDFRDDGKVYISLDGEQDTASYALQTDTKILFEGGTFDIQTLTDNAFKLYRKETDPATSDFLEVTINLKK